MAPLDALKSLCCKFRMPLAPASIDSGWRLVLRENDMLGELAREEEELPSGLCVIVGAHSERGFRAMTTLNLRSSFQTNAKRAMPQSGTVSFLNPDVDP